jgi:RNA polymerase sigma factor (sigma-70 family)
MSEGFPGQPERLPDDARNAELGDIDSMRASEMTPLDQSEQMDDDIPMEFTDDEINVAVEGSAPVAELSDEEDIEPDSLGAFASLARNYDRLTPDEERQCGDLITAARKMGLVNQPEVERLTLANLRLLVAVTKWYEGKVPDLDDLAQELYLGLWHAAETFDPSDAKFVTHAVQWMRRFAQAEKARSKRIVSTTSWHHQQMGQYEHVVDDLQQETGQENPPEAMVGERLGVTLKNLRERLVYELTSNNIFIDDLTFEPVDTESDIVLELGEVVADPAAFQALQEVETRLNAAGWSRILNGLNIIGRDWAIVCMRLGINDAGKVYNQTQVGKFFGIRRQAVYQIQSKTLAKIRNSPEALALLSGNPSYTRPTTD